MVAKLPVLFFHCILLFVGATANDSGNDGDFEYLTFAQFWPSTSCRLFEMLQERCNVSKGLTGWTIHGLWPSNTKRDQPANCNPSMKFDFSQIKNLQPKLERFWHQFNSSALPTSLWKHEWEKHGTCASTLPSLKGEMNFFSQTLSLHSKLDTLKALNASGIAPNYHKPYLGADFNKALVKYYKTKPVIVCLRKKGRSYLDQIYLCFDKTFKPRDCSQTTMPRVLDRASPFKIVPCHNKEQIYYRPLKVKD